VVVVVREGPDEVFEFVTDEGGCVVVVVAVVVVVVGGVVIEVVPEETEGIEKGICP
jgi:hypothetical protein